MTWRRSSFREIGKQNVPNYSTSRGIILRGPSTNSRRTSCALGDDAGRGDTGRDTPSVRSATIARAIEILVETDTISGEKSEVCFAFEKGRLNAISIGVHHLIIGLNRDNVNSLLDGNVFTLPAGYLTGLKEDSDVVLLFAETDKDLEKRFPPAPRLGGGIGGEPFPGCGPHRLVDAHVLSIINKAGPKSIRVAKAQRQSNPNEVAVKSIERYICRY